MVPWMHQNLLNPHYSPAIYAVSVLLHTPSTRQTRFAKTVPLHDDFKSLMGIDEPSLEEAALILEGIVPSYEEHHGVKFESEAIREAAKFTANHLRESKLPDKATDVDDECGARQQNLPEKKS